MNDNDWDNNWKQSIDRYLNTAPRTAIFIKWILRDNVKTTLELASGSSRDSLYLAECGHEVVASDYAEKTIEHLAKRFRKDNLTYCQINAFKIPFQNDQFDLSFHNGFFVLFEDNKTIYELLNEQARVTAKYMLIIVHNKLNLKLVKRFEELANYNSVYNIRFFFPEEIEKIIKNSGIPCKKIRILKFGGLFDVFYRRKIKRVFPNPLYPFGKKIVPWLYKYQDWASVERIACLVEL